MKKINTKWLIAIGGILLAAVAAVALLLVFGKEQPKAEKEPEYKIYWNVEREYYKTGKYSHQQVGEDLFRVLLTTDGEQYQVEIRGYELVQKLDTLEIVGLLFDEEGIAIDVADVDSCTGGYAAKQYYVESVDGNKVVVNNSPYFTGYSKTLYLNDQTGIYDVSDSGPLCGYSTQLAYNDEIFAVEDKQGNVTHVFTKPYVYPDKVYWNVDKPYDSVNKLSTRQPNAYMEYEMDFILNGERVTYICKDLDVVNKIDGSRVCGLVLDENNQIVDYIPVKTATNGGRLGATNYYVTNLDYQNGKYLFRKTSTNSPLSSFLSFYPSQDMKIYDMTGNEGDIGMPTDVRIDDRTICVLDNRTMISIVYVVARGVDSPLYWNVDRDWNKTTQSTNRRPDSAGWYYFTMAAEGKQIKVKTQSLEFANAIDKAINVGLKLNGDVVERVYASSSVYPAGLYGSYYKITDITSDGVITSEKTTDGKTTIKTAKVAEDCRYYNVSSTAAVEGEEISFKDLYVGDTIHAYKNFNGEIQIILVVTSYSNSPIYWNVDKAQYWDSKNEVSTRVKGADGYYHILLAVNGKQVTLRTADKKIVDNIDGRTCMGLAVNGSTITKVYGATQTRNTKGGLFASSWYVTDINGKVLTATNDKETDKHTMAANCQVYNVSKHADLVGEKSTVQVGDQIRCLLNENKQISVIFVLNKVNHKNQHTCTHCNENVTWRPWNGSSTMADGGHYVLTGNSTVTKGVSVKEGQTVTLCLNGYTLTHEKSRVLGTVEGTLNLIDCVGTGHIHGQTNNSAPVALVDGGTINIYGGTYTANEVTEEKNGGLFTIIGGGQINLYDGVLTGGKTNGYGGNINISNGSFTMYDGEISNGTSAEGQYGGNIALSGSKAVLNIKGGIISGGVSGSYGGNIAMGKTGAQLLISGGTISGGMATTHGGNISVALGEMTMIGGSISGGVAQTYGSNISAVNDSVISLADAQITEGQIMLRNSGGITLGGKLTISELYLYNHTFTLSAEKPLQDSKIGIAANKHGVIAEKVGADISGQFVATNFDEIVSWKDQQLLIKLEPDCPMYWNVDKTQYWDSKNEASTRVPGADGYYQILFAVGGEQVTLRTDDKKMVDNIDGRTCMGLAVNGNIITKVYAAAQTRNTIGGLFASSWYVTAIDGNTITASSSTKTETRAMAADCQVYNVSANAALVGEKSTVQVGDQIRCLLNENQQISVLYILNKSDHKNQHTCSHCNENVTWKSWDGSSTMADGGHYVLSGDSTVTKGVNVQEGQTVTLCLNGYTLTHEKSRVLGTVEGTLNLIDCVGTGHIHGQANNNASIAMVDGGTINIYGGTYTANEITAEKNGGLFTIIGGGQINLYDGIITGGKTNGYGGNINISNGSFTMYGGEISNGTSAEGQYGGNIALSGEKAVLTVKGGTISGGNSGSYGGNIALAKSGAKLIISGGKISGGTATTHGGNISVAVGEMTVTGGSIFGGVAQTYGGNISAVNDAVISLADAEITEGQVMLRNSGGITLGGKLIISDLYLNNHIFTLSAEKPLKDSRIGIAANKQGLIAENVSADISGQFVATNPEETVVWKDQQLILRSGEPHTHCHCGGFGDAEHVCDETIEWIPVTDKMVLEDGGHYYLQTDMDTQLAFAENATVYLCLNGHTLQNPNDSTVRVFKDVLSGQTLNIYDCGETGKIHGRANNNAPIALVKGTLNIYGGTYTAEAVTAENKNGGILMAMNNGVINFYDGTITGGNTTGMGGCVYITNNAAFTMYGGSITAGTSATHGNTFAVAGEAVLTVLGGEIGMGSNEDCVYHNSANPIVVGGAAQVAKIYLEGAAVLTTSDTVPLENAQIGVEKVTDGVLVQNISNEQLTCITNLGKGQMVWEQGVLSLKLPHSHCVCVGADVKPADHTCEDLIWQGISGSTTITADGNFFLDFSAKAAAITVADGVHAKLCLNGAKIYAMNTITLGEGSTLDICDCSEEQSGIIGMSGNATRGPVVLDYASTLNLWSGTITGKMNSNQKQAVVISHKDARFNMFGGAIVDGVGGNVTMSNGSFYQYGGAIIDGYSTGNGGNVLMSGAAVFYQYGGTISGGSADKKGGNVAMINANNCFYQYGGSIVGGTAGTYGGNVSLNNGAQFEMNGANALIADGVSTGASQGGGNVHIHKNIGKFTLINGAITGGIAAGKGGSVYVESGKLDVQGGSITGGTAGGLGNCVYVTVSGEIEVAEGATVEDIHQ